MSANFLASAAFFSPAAWPAAALSLSPCFASSSAAFADAAACACAALASACSFAAARRGAEAAFFLASASAFAFARAIMVGEEKLRAGLAGAGRLGAQRQAVV